MKLEVERNALSIQAKNGIGFLYAAIIIWSIITGIFLSSIDLLTKNIFMLMSTGLMFPLSVGISTAIKADWKLEGHPLGKLGLMLNIAQIIYFPILFLMMVQYPEAAVTVFAIITGAHFFPYGWLYRTTPYAVMAPIMSITYLLLSLIVGPTTLWFIPLSMVILLLVLVFLLQGDLRKKSK